MAISKVGKAILRRLKNTANTEQSIIDILSKRGIMEVEQFVREFFDHLDKLVKDSLAEQGITDFEQFPDEVMEQWFNPEPFNRAIDNLRKKNIIASVDFGHSIYIFMKDGYFNNQIYDKYYL